MLASVELKKRENRDDLDFSQMNGYTYLVVLLVSVYIFLLETSACASNNGNGPFFPY